ncbi:3-hydroxyacyl-CoA dehydrogenase [Pusillimonas sp. CC-YST705]|uniref:3-hydroxyacyl-CoA dehydrogenase n=1 Tax=Mesopusillimonas faecipullorum TaxID=2755040 RepID=A0ABS8CDY4_9BURK|nr:3-hydroxyacyl-CoA dehydrogenase NAD-binding domain-containing protein [Mesopusillimonas faecipullorum]MCB5363789.1 3-hydroxyacyl-CoA dehydrogenase [Mesopusillimonas faecipullorum]
MSRQSSPLLPVEQVKSVGMVGTGSVGASWAALFLAQGLSVYAYNPDPDAERLARAFIQEAWPSVLALCELPPETQVPGERLVFVDSLQRLAQVSDVLQENAPERPELKAQILAELDQHAPASKIILSSTGGIQPSLMQQACARPERLVVLHPFNPTHLVPLVEVVGGQQTSPEVVDWAMEFARRVGKHPVRLKREAVGHMANRLQFALLRESVHCLIDGIASAEDIDDAVRYGLAPRWTLLGGLLTLHLAGGAGGLKGILDHAGDAIEGWWNDLGSPVMDEQTRAKLVQTTEEIARHRPVEDWIRWRDENLPTLLKLQRQMTAPLGED